MPMACSSRDRKLHLKHKSFSGVAEDNENALGRLSGSRQNTDPLGGGYKFRQGPNLHFLHHPVAMRLDGAFGTA